MQTEYISKRQVKVPDKAPAALGSLLVKTQEGLNQGGGLDAVRWLHDSLAFLTEFFASFAVGALNTVGPYSASVERLLQQPASLDRSERLLSQAFVDWKAHPHHPAYESLRDSFFLTSRLQSSRYAPRRHTRWLGVEGRAVAGLERLTRWSRRIDLVVSANDEEGARNFVRTYTPVLWIWTDAVSDFFQSWTVDVVTEVKDGKLGLAGSASKSDVRLDLVQVDQIAGLKCRYQSDGNGGVNLAGFVSGSMGSPSESSLEPAPTPTTPPVSTSASSSASEDLQLVFDPATGNFVPKNEKTEGPSSYTPASGSPSEAPEPAASSTSEAVVSIPDGPEVAPIESVPEQTVPTAPVEATTEQSSPPETVSTPGISSPPVPPTEVTTEDSSSVEAPLFSSSKEDEQEKPLSGTTEDGPVNFESDALGAMLSSTLPKETPASGAEVPPPIDLSEIPSPDELDSVPAPHESSASDDVPRSIDLSEIPSPDEFDSVPAPGEPSAPVDFAPPLDLSEIPSPGELDSVPASGEPSAPVEPDEVLPPIDLSEIPSPDELDSAPAPGEPSAPVEPDEVLPPIDLSEIPSPDELDSVPAPGEPSAPVEPDEVLPPIDLSEIPSPDELDSVPAPHEPSASDDVRPSIDLSEIPSPDQLDSVPAPDEPPAPTEPDAVPASIDFSEIPSPDQLDSVPAPDEPRAPTEPDDVPASIDLSEIPSPDQLDSVPAPDEPPAPTEPDDVRPSIDLSEIPSPDELDSVPAPDEPPAPVELDSTLSALGDLSPGSGIPEATDFSGLPSNTEIPGSPLAPPDFAAPASPDFTAPPDLTTSPLDALEIAGPGDDVEFKGSESPDLASAEVDGDVGGLAGRDVQNDEPSKAAPTGVVEQAGTLSVPEAQPDEQVAESQSSDSLESLPHQISLGDPGESINLVDARRSSGEDIQAPTDPTSSERIGFDTPESLTTQQPAAPQDAPGAPTSSGLSLPDLSSPAGDVPDFGAPEPPEINQAVEPTLEMMKPVETAPLDLSSSPAESGKAPLVDFSQPSETSAPQFTPPTLQTDAAAPEGAQIPVFKPPTEAASGIPVFAPPSTGDSQESAPATVELPLGGLSAADQDDSSGPATEQTVEVDPAAELQPEELKSVEIETPTANREMGVAAEEILEDDYKFSAEDGPARPQWTGWSVDQREAVQAVCEQLIEQRKTQSAESFLSPVMGALGGQSAKIQVLMEPGCGKTQLAEFLAQAQAEGSSHVPLMASWDGSRPEQLPGQVLLEFYHQLRDSKRQLNVQIVLPEPETVSSLATSADQIGFSQAFQRLIGQLAALNRKPLLLILDEPSATVREALSMTPPQAVRFLTLLNSEQADERLGMMVDLGRRWKAASAELYGESARAYFDHDDASLLRIALATEMEKEGLVLDGSLGLAEEAALELDKLYQPLLASLSLEKAPISLDDMDQWFLNPDDVMLCLKTFPSLFKLASTRLSPVLGLAHSSIQKLVVSTLDEERALVARKLLGWVVAQLERTAPDRYGGLQVREIVFRNFLRLYRYAKASRDPAILEWVVRNKELQRRRIALTEHLEKPGSRYDLHELLDLLVEQLDELVTSGSCDDLRDELGWAQSNLALNQLKLGLLPQAREDIDRAVQLFERLVKQEKQYEFRPALSTTYYRASRVYEAASETEKALEYAKLAVQGFIDLVEDRGRTELSSRLGLALAHRGGLYYQGENLAAAKDDLQRASQLLGSSEGQEGNDSIRTIVEIELELAAILTKEGDNQTAVQVSTKAVKLATEAVEEKGMDEFQPLLATCHAVRAKAYSKMKDDDRAIRDIAKSISLRNLSVDEGRLDQRYHLAADLQLRAQIDLSRGALEDASRDLKQAVELLEILTSEGRPDAAPQLLRCLQERAKINLAAGNSQAGTEDLKRALSMNPQPALKLSIMETLLSAYAQSGSTTEALSVAQSLLASYHQAQAWESYGNVQLVRAAALEKSGDLKGALEAYSQAASLIAQLLAQGQTDELLLKVSNAYLGVGTIEFKMGQPAKSVPQLKQAIDVLLHLFQQRGNYGVLPKLLTAYSMFSAGNTAANRLAEAKQALQSGFDVLGYMETHGGQGSVPTAEGLEQEKGELHRQRANLLLAEGDANNALNDAEEAIRNFLVTRQYNQRGPWKDEMARTWSLKSRILFTLKDFTQADKSIQEAISHFEERVREGQYEYFSDMMKAFSVRADHAGKSGKIDLVLEEYNRMLSITQSAAQSGAEIDSEVELAKIFERRAQVYQQQNLLNEAYADYEKVIGLYLNQVSAKGRAELASELVRTYLSRGKMTTRAGHGQHAIGDFSEAVNVAKALVSQGQVSAVPELATALHERAEVYRGLGRGAEALQDLQGCVGFRMQLIQANPDPQLMGELGRALLLQGTLLVAAGQAAQAAQSLDQANAFFTNLVESQGRQEYSSELAQSLIQRVSLSSDKRDPAMREVLVKAVNLVNQQAQEGKPVGRDFAIECLKTVVELLQQEDFNAIGALIDSVLDLVETVVTDTRGDQDFVKLTDLLLAASAGLIDDRRTARRPHFLSLACVSCNREIQMFGNNSLPRLVYCLYELGQALERSKPPAVLNYIGSSFALLGELAGQQQANEDFMRELKMMISTWRSLPPQIPALANVSRHMLSQLLRLT